LLKYSMNLELARSRIRIITERGRNSMNPPKGKSWREFMLNVKLRPSRPTRSLRRREQPSIWRPWTVTTLSTAVCEAQSADPCRLENE
jgi:hypothetical protein